jgi:hypothetical protein
VAEHVRLRRPCARCARRRSVGEVWETRWMGEGGRWRNRRRRSSSCSKTKKSEMYGRPTLSSTSALSILFFPSAFSDLPSSLSQTHPAGDLSSYFHLRHHPHYLLTPPLPSLPLTLPVCCPSSRSVPRSPVSSLIRACGSFPLSRASPYSVVVLRDSFVGIVRSLSVPFSVSSRRNRLSSLVLLR